MSLLKVFLVFANKILRYLKGTMKLDMLFSANVNEKVAWLIGK